ncbi:hypothetical protein ABIQ69_01250 [Agromyces sp. G08B096]|uniref:ABC transporter permease n=1 Tax=Agromyces sp. G08B096 TaxID=3156399 RepID=A0AAU7W7W5_9MICO
MVALVGVGLFLIAMVVAGVLDALGAATDAPDPIVVLAMLGGVLLAGGFWAVWGVWSVTLDRSEPAPGGALRARTRLELGATVSTALGAMLVVGSALPFLVLEDGPDELAMVLLVTTLIGAGLLALTLAVGAVAGAVLLAGAGWWWVGVVFLAGFALLTWQLVTGRTWLSGALLLAAGGGLYVLALAIGRAKRRGAALEADRLLQHGDPAARP